MIELAIKQVMPSIDALPFTKVNGGLSFRATLYDQYDDHSSEYKKIKYSVPIFSTTTMLDCWNNGKYQELTPNSKKTSIFYWESSGDTPAKDLGKRIQMKTSARLVWWLNLAKIGKTHTSALADYGSYTISPLVEANLIKEIAKEYLITSGDFNGTKVKFYDAVISKKDVGIFSKYTYKDDIEQLLFYPYDFGAIDFSIEITIPKSCIADITVNNEISCI